MTVLQANVTLTCESEPRQQIRLDGRTLPTNGHDNTLVSYFLVSFCSLSSNVIDILTSNVRVANEQFVHLQVASDAPNPPTARQGAKRRLDMVRMIRFD